MNVLGIAGWSGSGKTTLILSLLGEFRRRGLRVSTIKHAHHKVEIDTPGKDSYEHRRAGAHEVMLVTGKRFALMHDFPDPDEEIPLHDLVARLTPVDLLLIEGFKTYAHPKLEVHRPSVGKPLLAPQDPHIVGIACDAPPEQSSDRPLLALNDISAVADFIVAHARPLLPPTV
ncbi:molybdopterin-guanine dinucleotide biosynthesis protein B [Insolitispirillum peregrinum]|mgnify:CR=1 FL=1|uniref:Molybdopterin guanine dinucleotide biosynthesis accessory protein MobB n=1 Tax=Insolitispirillum peregrinum TaxID=80876 RepID=A0A1N7J9J7_9PROT|nr:molybdopterin-guanine dinucleotide biosynthesis protein B [Insolitispirillum peregrinum]SIS45980.1 molybdopterin guanine dinucleotide biosynthesis accessory protein MobB [Insolitispirillum peregrinum]